MLFSETPTALALRMLLDEAELQRMDAAILERLRVILFFVDHHHSITQTCRHFGISRSTFHRWIERFDPRDLSSLQDRSHEASSCRQSTVSSETIDLIRRYRMRYTQMGKEKISELLLLDSGISLSPSTVGRVIERECLYFSDTPFHWKKRLACRREGAGMPALNKSEATLLQGQQDSFDESSYSENESLAIRQVSPVRKNAEVEPQVRRFTFWKFLLLASVVSNIVFASAIVGIAVFERSVSEATVASDMQRIDSPELLHTAPTAVPFQ